jgi:hypothetical protein
VFSSHIIAMRSNALPFTCLAVGLAEMGVRVARRPSERRSGVIMVVVLIC